MKRLGLHEIRKEFLDFFASKEHLILPSASLVPKNDKSLLLIGAGMAPMKKFFTGEEVPPSKRVSTCQKCVRTGDIENVGHTDRHATFFEMLGNFSFGDYFKHEATAWAWEFLTKNLELDPEKLWVTVYHEDDEAYAIWRDEVGIPEERIVRLGKEDNFWELEVGPSGPCSEIYVDRGEEHGCGCEDCKPGCECDRFIEVWNLVFTQFDKDEAGEYHPLDHPNIDTGMGLERIATVLQETKNIFEIDAIQDVLRAIEAQSGYAYGSDEKKDISVRVITDHIRAMTFLIGDSVVPSNEGRGYVLRRLIRRAARHGRLLGIEEPFLSTLAEKVIASWGEHYENLKENKEMIQRVILREEEKFLATIDQGMQLLAGRLDALSKEGKSVLSGEDAFRLYDTYGFPFDLTQEMAEEEGFSVDEETFHREMEEQRQRARAARDDSDNIGWSHTDRSDALAAYETKFVGYEAHQCPAILLAILDDNLENCELHDGDEGIFILDQTVCYPQGGGQVGDRGWIEGDDFSAEVLDTRKSKSGVIIHRIRMSEGTARLGEVRVKIDEHLRRATERNHSVTHLLHKSLKEVLGSHVNQAGSEVTPRGMRFDFTHYEGVSAEDLKKIESLVNEKIYERLPVIVEHMSYKEAQDSGAVGLFEDKYGDDVRVVSMGDFSKELCGGTHVNQTSDIGIFKILSESGVAAGVRRIEALTGEGVYHYLQELVARETELSALTKVRPEQVQERVQGLMDEAKELRQELRALKEAKASAQLADVSEQIHEVHGKRVLAISQDGLDAEQLRNLAEKLRDQHAPLVVILGSGQEDGKVLLACTASKEYVKEDIHAGKLIGRVAKICGGGGGGRPDFATAGGRQREKLDEALQAVDGFLAE